MRRMYSQAELSAIIKEVFLEDVASGQIDLPDLIEQALPEVDLSVADFSNVDFVAKTLKQTQANYSFDLASYIASDDPTNFEVQGEPFAVIKVINGCLHIIGACTFKNVDTNAHSFKLGVIDVSIPEDIGQYIFDTSGKNLTESVGAYTFIRAIPSTTDGNSFLPIRLYHQAQNTLRLSQSIGTNVSAGGNISFSFEATLTII